MSAAENKAVVLNLIQQVWREGRLERLRDFWTGECLNHADPSPENRGLDALHRYHAAFAQAFAGFADVRIEIARQIAESDLVVTHMVMSARQVGTFLDMPPTGRETSMASIRIDRLEDGKIVEHWSVADLAGLVERLRAP